MEKIKSALSVLTNIQIDLKYSNKNVNPFLSYLIVVLGAYKMLKILNSAYFSLIYPQLRKLFYKIFKNKNRLLSSNKEDIERTN